ncbi:IS5 family transposase [Nocardia asiatica]|uniref:IS5 family transposase n=1 Tax=Nocardia asiatica TaxID=209252 RepID=UPI003EDFCD62
MGHGDAGPDERTADAGGRDERLHDQRREQLAQEDPGDQTAEDCPRRRSVARPSWASTAGTAVIDSQTVRGADTVTAATAGYDAGKRIKGRKRHIATDTLGLFLAVVVTPALIQDSDAARRLLAALRTRFAAIELVWTDGGYAGRRDRGENVVALTTRIVKRDDTATGFEVLPRRWVIERSFGWLTKHRRLVRDYETRPDHHEAMVYIAAIRTLTRRLARVSDHPA